jgi:hypothetical protein
MFRGQPASVLPAGDDSEAKEAVAALARDAGYDPVDAGPLWSAVNVDKVAGVMVTIAYVVGAGFDQALRIVRRWLALRGGPPERPEADRAGVCADGRADAMALEAWAQCGSRLRRRQLPARRMRSPRLGPNTDADTEADGSRIDDGSRGRAPLAPRARQSSRSQRRERPGGWLQSKPWM